MIYFLMWQKWAFMQNKVSLLIRNIFSQYILSICTFRFNLHLHCIYIYAFRRCFYPKRLTKQYVKESTLFVINNASFS